MAIFHSRTNRWFLQAFLLMLVALFGKEVRSQSHGPCEIIYLVRDEKGELLDPAKLDAIESPKGEEMKSGTCSLRNPDGTYNDKVKCIKSRLDIGGRPVALSEMTLKYQGKTMRLVFNLRLIEMKRVVQGLPFQEGAFTLDKEKWVKAEK